VFARVQPGKLREFVSTEGKRIGFGHSFAALHGTAKMGGKCKFAASAPRLCQFPNSGHPSVGHCTLDAAAPHDGTEPIWQFCAMVIA
jgi:hypothetical protein